MDFAARFKLFNACVLHCAQWDLFHSWAPSLTMQYKYIILYFNIFLFDFSLIQNGVYCYFSVPVRHTNFTVIFWLFKADLGETLSVFCKSFTEQHFQCFANLPLHNIRNKSLYIWIGGWCVACLYTQYMLMYLKDKMHDFLQIFSFAHHGIEELESTCLLSHLEVVAVITVCYIF